MNSGVRPSVAVVRLCRCSVHASISLHVLPHCSYVLLALLSPPPSHLRSNYPRFLRSTLEKLDNEQEGKAVRETLKALPFLIKFIIRSRHQFRPPTSAPDMEFKVSR